LAEPFFALSVRRLRIGIPRALELETDPTLLTESAIFGPAVTPAGIIVHMSRCGSTLVLRSLAAAEDVVPASEADPFTTAITLARDPSEHCASIGRALLAALTRVFSHYEGIGPKRVVIKCSIDGLASIRAIHQVWPDVPCVILIRNPIEVLVSNLQDPANWWPRALLRGMPRDVEQSGHQERLAWALGRFCAAAVDGLDDHCTVIDYEDLCPAGVRWIGQYFGLSFTGVAEQRFLRTFEVDAKRPDRPFKADTDRKRRDASSSVQQSAQRWITEPYSQLKQRARHLGASDSEGNTTS
jgi:hypothetical protein